MAPPAGLGLKGLELGQLSALPFGSWMLVEGLVDVAGATVTAGQGSGLG
jgi:hypothetical protein